MNSYSFVLNFNLPHREDQPENYLDALFEAGCDDAAVGVGQFGMIGLDFTRRAHTAEDALRSAIRSVQNAIPGSNLVQVGPDLVGLTDVADIFGFTRQNMRKYATGQLGTTKQVFPTPVIIGAPNLWHLAEIVSWLKLNTSVQTSDGIFELSKAAAEINGEVVQDRLRRIRQLA